MQENGPISWTSIIHDLEVAAVRPQEREARILRALEHLLTCLPATATALIWPCQKCKTSWKVSYVGLKRQAMHRWLSARLNLCTAVMIDQLQYDLGHILTDMPPFLLLPLRTLSSSQNGVWIIWGAPSSVSTLTDIIRYQVEEVRTTFEALLEVKNQEERYFSASSPIYDKELIEALAQGDAQALSAFLSLTRVVAQADCTFWARVYQNELETVAHLGAKNSGFGFTLGLGRGLGGHVAVQGTPIVIPDYRNSPYRDPSVSDMVDREQLRSAIALPVRFHISSQTSNPPVKAVLYASRRSTKAFSLVENLLVQRQGELLQQLSQEKRTPAFFLPALQPQSEYKAAWYNLVLHATRVEAVEAWAQQIIKGPVIVTDKNGHPYVTAHREELASMRNQSKATQVLSLAAPGISEPGQVYLYPSIPLPPFQWPDFSSDLVLACNAVIAHMEQQQNFLGNQRKQWLRTLLHGKPSPYVEQEGHQLGLPIEHGQLWVLAWSLETPPTAKSPRQRTASESVVLEMLKSSLIFLDNETAVVLLKEPAPQSPSRVRDALLKNGEARPLWIVYGARYQSFLDLKTTLAHTILLAHKARREKLEEYVLDVYAFDIDSLLENPKMSQDLYTFAKKLLTPLIKHDASNSSQFTETFVLAQTLGSAQAVAEKLGVHVNTIRYRLHKAEEILGKELTSPKEHMAMAFAAFIWERFTLSEEAE
jgi:hypothetical protein